MAFSGDQLYRFYRFGQTRTRLTSIDPIIAFFCEWREYADRLYSATNIWRAQSQCAGGAGCGQPPAHKARRKIFFAGSQLSSNQTISGYVSCGPCGLDGGTRKNPHVVCSSAKTCRTNHKDQPHRRPAAAALPNLAPNPGIKIIARALYFKKKRLLLELATRLICLRCRSTTSPRISSARKNIRAEEKEGSAGVPGAHLVAFLHAAGPGERSRPSTSTWPRRSEGEQQGGGSSGLRDYEDFDGGGGVDFHGWKKRETKTRLRVVAGSRGPALSSAGFAGGLASTRKEIAARPHLPQSANLRGG